MTWGDLHHRSGNTNKKRHSSDNGSQYPYWDQAQSLWSGSTDSKTLDFQRTNPRKYQIELTQRKPLKYKTRHHPTTNSILCWMPHLSNRQNKNTYPIINRQDYHLTQPCSSEEKQTNKQKLSTNLTLYKTSTNHWTNLRRAETKREKESNLEAWEGRLQTQEV